MTSPLVMLAILIAWALVFCGAVLLWLAYWLRNERRIRERRDAAGRELAVAVIEWEWPNRRSHGADTTPTPRASA